MTLQRLYKPQNSRDKPGEESLAVIDEVGDNYILNTVGWVERQRVFLTTLYVRLRNDKFWIEVDWLEDGIVTALLEAGVPKQDIVLGFHHPEERPCLMRRLSVSKPVKRSQGRFANRPYMHGS